jgi:hypothetical protein
LPDLLREKDFSLQANSKTLEGASHPDRDAQFSYINDQATEHLTTGDPVISVDTKKTRRGVQERRAGMFGSPVRYGSAREDPGEVRPGVTLDRRHVV